MMTDTADSTNKILEEIKKSKQELKVKIEALEVKILLKIEDVSRKITALEEESKRIEDKVEYLEKIEKKNNIIIFGLKQVQAVTPESICVELQRLTGISLTLSDLNNVYPLGKQENSPIKIEFLSYLKKATVLKNAGKLKGSNISIANDLTPKQRAENKILRKHLHLAKQDKNNTCYIKQYKLYVNNEVYTPEDLQQSEEEDSDQIKSNSAPGSPSIQLIVGKEERGYDRNKILKPKLFHNVNIPTQSLTTQKSTKQTEKQAESDKRKTRSGSTSTTK